jgi:hypothetical protein
MFPNFYVYTHLQKDVVLCLDAPDKHERLLKHSAVNPQLLVMEPIGLLKVTLLALRVLLVGKVSAAVPVATVV